MERKELEALVRSMRRMGAVELTYRRTSDGELELHVRFDGGAAPVAASPLAEERPVVAPRAEGRAITSPIVGTFYRSPSPDAAAYVNVGDRVKKGQIVCIIEAMKLMNQIESDVDGTIVEILVENGEPVQFGHPLFRVSPA